MIQLVSSVPTVPLPDPLWYEYLREILPDQPDETLDIVQLTRDAERKGLTIVDIILYNLGVSPDSTLPARRQSMENGMVLVVSARDMARISGLDVDVQCYEEGHPRDWVVRYPNRLWVSRFWFGHVWFYHLGVEHLMVDIPLLLNRAWLSPLARMMPLQLDGPVHDAHVRLVEHFPDLIRYLRSEWNGIWSESDRQRVVVG